MASIHISEQISNGNFDGNKVIQLWNLTFLVQCIFLNVGISLLCCVIHSPPPPLWPPPHAPFMKFFISPIPWVAVVPSSPPRRVVRRGLIKYFLLYYRGNDSATDHHRPRDCRVSTDERGEGGGCHNGPSTVLLLGQYPGTLCVVAHKSQMWFNHLNRLNVNGLRSPSNFSSRPLLLLSLVHPGQRTSSHRPRDVRYYNPQLRIRLQYKSN